MALNSAELTSISSMLEGLIEVFDAAESDGVHYGDSCVGLYDSGGEWLGQIKTLNEGGGLVWRFTERADD